MPYLTDERKQHLKNSRAKVVTAGDLTYLLTTVYLDPDAAYSNIGAYVSRYLPEHPRYENYAIVLGCLDSAYREIQRRCPHSKVVWFGQWLADFADEFYAEDIAPYEDEKIQQNGDVFV